MRQDGMKELRQRIVDWAFRDAERELLCGFPLVRKLDTVPARKYILYLNVLPPERSIMASRVLVRRMNEPMLLRRQPKLSEQEMALLSNFLGQGEGLGSQMVKLVEDIPSS